MKPVECNCNYHKVQNSWIASNPRASKQQAEAIHFAYWSTHCARCGCGIPFAGHADMAVCASCDEEMAGEES